MKPEDGSRTRLLKWLCVGEMVTGTGLTLLGCILPTLILNWHLSDRQAGVLFAAQFAGASLGAILVSGNYFKSLVRGCALLIASALSLALLASPSQAFLFFFFIYGLGLGLTMTAISMLAGSTFPERRGSVLSVLNAYWGAGAVLCPFMAALWVKQWKPENLFLVIAAVAVVLFIPLIASAPTAGEVTRVREESPDFPLRAVLAFAVVAFLYVGVESSVSGWMMAYVHRLEDFRHSISPIAASCFWVALLCGRALAPAVLRRISEPALLILSIAGSFFSVSLLLIGQSPVGVVLSAAAAGFTLGPIYPLCLARILALTRDSPNSKWVFATAGLGSATMPWLTGNLSSFAGSLRVGLTIPLFAICAMLALAAWQTRTAQTRKRVELAGTPHS